MVMVDLCRRMRRGKFARVDDVKVTILEENKYEKLKYVSTIYGADHK